MLLTIVCLSFLFSILASFSICFVTGKNDGQMDWKTLAKIITANLLGEVSYL